MLRTARRLRLELCEDRSLPAGLIPTADPPTNPVIHPSTATSGADTSDQDASEYTQNEKPGAKPGPKNPERKSEYPNSTPEDSDHSAEYARKEAAEYLPTTRPAAPPMPMGLVPPAAPTFVTPAPLPVPISTAVVAVPEGNFVPPVPAVLPAVPVAPSIAPVPPEDAPVDPRPGPRGGTEDQPPSPDTDVPPAGPAPSGAPFLDDLDLHVDLGGWAKAVGGLLDGLDVVVRPLVAESPWSKLGYWALAIGAVGVSVELTRQGFRTRSPDPEDGPAGRMRR